ncbi:recombinase family protein [Micromonospora sp. NPDC050417]|uniref:recombinase family protein n=1 Tax=Micromonospora sp. NPDC050417 TaxID=3364280 RepID=UPI0037B2702C
MTTSDLYARKSTEDQGHSAARQERDWRADCAANDLQPGRVFADPDLSASRYARKQRPDFAELLEHIGSGEAEMVSLWETSRGSRRAGEWISFLDLCRDGGVLIRIFGGDDPRTYDPRKRRDYRALADEGLDAQDESDKLSERVRAGTRDSAVSGKPPGPLLFGYTRIFDERGRYVEQVPHPQRAALVRQWAANTLADVVPALGSLPAVAPTDDNPVPLHTQANALNDAGVPTPSGEGTWVGGHLNRYLRNPGYLGHRVHHDVIVARNAWSPILDEDTHGRLVALLETPGRRHHGNSKLKHQLSGAALCGPCRRPIRAKPIARTGALRYFCPYRGCLRVSAMLVPMDASVDRIILARLRRTDATGVFAPGVDQVAIAATRKEVRQLQGRLDEHVVESSAGRLSARALGLVERDLQPKIDAAERKLRTLLTPPALRGEDPAELADRWPDLPVARRRGVIVALAEIVLSPVGKAGRWSDLRLAESRWVGDDRTWGEIVAAGGSIVG